MITQEQIISSGSWIWSSGAGNTLPRLEQPAGLLRKTLYPRREAGFKKFTVTPWCGELLRASGEIPTPCGNIKVSWKRNGDRIDLQVDHPAELQYVPTV